MDPTFFFNSWFLLIPCISALIGWLTNWIAVKMLFHPRLPWRLGFMTIQGVFPKRQEQLAQKLGHLVATELLRAEDITTRLIDIVDKEEVRALLLPKISARIFELLPKELPMLAMFLSPEVKETLTEALNKVLSPVLKEMVETLSVSLAEEFQIEALVQSKVQELSSDKLEELLNRILRTEFRFIEILGGVVGFLIGLFQLAILNFSVA